MKMSEKDLKIITRTAATAALEHLEKEKQKQLKEKHDRRLRNVKLLLRNYRSFAAHVAEIKLDINELDEKLELEELDTDEFKLMSIKRSKRKTLAMVQFINKMLVVYRTICEQTGRSEDIRRYESVFKMYIAEVKMTAEDISEAHNTALRTTYNDIEKASKDLVVLIFGVDGVRFFN